MFVIVSAINTAIYAFQKVVKRGWNGWNEMLTEIALTDCVTISYASSEVGGFHFVKHDADSADSKNATNGKNAADSADSKKEAAFSDSLSIRLACF